MRRLGVSALVVWGAISVIFVVLRVVPGDPAVSILGPDASQEQLASLRRELGLDRSIGAQYLAYLSGAARGDFGDSLRENAAALSVVWDRLPATLLLATGAMAIAVVVGVSLGMAAGRRPSSTVDEAIRLVSLAGQSLPTFWVGIMLLLVFSRTMGWLPSTGNATPAHLVLPAVTLGLPAMSVFVRMTRGGLVEAMTEEYVTTARAKGTKESVIVRRHGLRNVLIPLVTVVGLQLG